MSAVRKMLSDSTASRPTLTQRLTERPEVESQMWAYFAISTLISVVGHVGSLLITVPLGVYLFWCRQRAALVRTQVEHDELAARADASQEPPTEPFRHGRHAR